MIGELFGEGTPADSEVKRQAVRAAQGVICVSENTKRDLVHLFGVDDSKVRVIYEASELSISMVPSDAPPAEYPYFLFVGSHQWPYKNFTRLLRSFATVCQRHSEVKLCIAGPSLLPEQRKLIDSLKMTHRIVETGRVSDTQLATLYHRSVALVYASLYEGFGIPPLEAMACGTAVIASNSSSIPEVVGDAALLIDPQSEEDIAAAMIKLLDDPVRREQLVRLGREREKLFSWEKMAAEIYELYCAVLGT
jgi:glycosyltransferase involved in cell wall biosynthesis